MLQGNAKVVVRLGHGRIAFYGLAEQSDAIFRLGLLQPQQAQIAQRARVPRFQQQRSLVETLRRSWPAHTRWQRSPSPAKRRPSPLVPSRVFA